MPDIEVTDEMIEAGRVAHEKWLRRDHMTTRPAKEPLWAAIYRAMRAKERERPLEYVDAGLSYSQSGSPGDWGDGPR